MAAIGSRSSSDRRRAAAKPGGNGRGRPKTAAPALTERLARLTTVNPGPHRVVSCYLKLEPRDRSRGKYLIKLKNRVRAVTQALPRLGLERQTHDEVVRDLERVQQYLRTPANLPSTLGLAIFACEGIGLFEALPLPVVHRSRLAVDRSPLVRELASVEDEFGRLLTVVLDRTAARFFEVTAYDTRELSGLRADSTRGKRFHGDKAGTMWGEHTYHNRIRQEKQRHFEAVARELFAIDRRQPGPRPGARWHRPRGRRGRAFPAQLSGRARHRHGAAQPEGRHAGRGARRHPGRARGLGAGDRARRGARDARGPGDRLGGERHRPHAPRAGARPGPHAPGGRRRERAGLPLRRRRAAWRGPSASAATKGEPVAVLDVVDDAIEEALRQGVDVNVVYEPDARTAVDGLAGLLRFR